MKLMRWDEWRGNLDGSVIVMRIKHLLSFNGYKLDLHKFIGEDAAECFHTHPAMAIRLIIRGGYIEEIEGGKLKVWKAPMIGIVRPELSHRVSTVFSGGAYSIWLRFPKKHKVQLRGIGWPSDVRYSEPHESKKESSNTTS